MSERKIERREKVVEESVKEFQYDQLEKIIQVLEENGKKIKFLDEQLAIVEGLRFVVTPIPKDVLEFVDEIDDLVDKVTEEVLLRGNSVHVFLGIGRWKTGVVVNSGLKIAHSLIYEVFDYGEERRRGEETEVEREHRFRLSKFGRYPIIYVIVPRPSLQYHYAIFLDKFLGIGKTTTEPYLEEVRDRVRRITKLNFDYLLIMGKKQYTCPLLNSPDENVRKMAYKCAVCRKFIKWSVEGLNPRHVVGGAELEVNEVGFVNIFNNYVKVKLPDEDPSDCPYANNFYKLYLFVKECNEGTRSRKVLFVVINYEAFLKHCEKLPKGFVIFWDEYDENVINAQTVKVDMGVVQELIRYVEHRNLPYGKDLLLRLVRITSRERRKSRAASEEILEFLDYTYAICQELLTDESFEPSEQVLNLCHGVRELLRKGGTFSIRRGGTPGFVYKIDYEDIAIEIAFQRVPVINMVMLTTPVVMLSGTPLDKALLEKIFQGLESRITFLEPNNPELKKMPGTIVLHYIPGLRKVTYHQLFTRGKPDPDKFKPYCILLARILNYIYNHKELQPCYIVPYPWYCITECIKLANNEELVETYPELKIFRLLKNKIDKDVPREKFLEMFKDFLNICSTPGIVIDKSDFVVFATNRIHRGINLPYLRSIVFPKYPIPNILSAFAQLCIKRIARDVLFNIADTIILQAIGRGARRKDSVVHIFTPDERVFTKVVMFGNEGKINLRIVKHDAQDLEKIERIEEREVREMVEEEKKVEAKIIEESARKFDTRRIEYVTPSVSKKDFEMRIEYVTIKEDELGGGLEYSAVIDVIKVPEEKKSNNNIKNDVNQGSDNSNNIDFD